MTEEISAQENNLDALLNKHFAGKVVRKDLTKLLKEGANVPVYVLEYLLGMYCASDDEATIQSGMTSVKRILAENYVRPDEAEKIASFLASSSPLLGYGDGKASVLNIDCREFQGEGFDLVFTCPPYWNLEKYSDIPADLSNVDDYESFLYQMSFVFDVCRRAMSPNAYCCFVVSDFRDYSEGRKRVNRLVPFVADMIHAGERSGLCLYDKVILRKPLGTAPARTKLWNNRKTVRIHEELLVFTRDRA